MALRQKAVFLVFLLLAGQVAAMHRGGSSYGGHWGEAGARGNQDVRLGSGASGDMHAATYNAATGSEWQGEEGWRRPGSDSWE